MPEKQLPACPNLEQYKKQAKDLARACRNGDPAAIARLRNHHPRPPAQRIVLADAQLVLAREHGFESWPRFAAHIEQLRIAASVADLDDPVDAFLRAALVPRDGTSHASGTLDEAEAILVRYSQVRQSGIYTAAVLADEDFVRAVLSRDPAAANTAGGPYGWEPLSHLCFSRYLRLDPGRSDAFICTARLLLDAGADANTGWYEPPDRVGGSPVWESVLYGAAGVAHHAELTRLLLERGADPNDGETPYHAPESYDNTVVQLLLGSGKLSALSKSWILARKADWHDYDGMKLALQHGADPNLVPHWGNSALQHAILRDNRLEMITLLLDHGADPLVPNKRNGRNAAQMAARRGRGDMLRVLAERNIELNLPSEDRLIAACAIGDRTHMDQLAASEPAVREALLSEGGDLLGAFAGVGNTDGVRCLLDLGVPVDAPYSGDAYFDTAKGSTALHGAAWRGNPDTVKLLIQRGADINARDSRGRTPLQFAVRACTDSYWKNRRSPEWIEPLLAAGAAAEGIEIPTGYPAADALLLQHSGAQ